MAPVYTHSTPGELARALGMSERAAAAVWRIAAAARARYPGMSLFGVSVTLEGLDADADVRVRGTRERWKAVALVTEAVVRVSHPAVAFMFPAAQRPSFLLCIPL
jgi:hypothetical protein